MDEKIKTLVQKAIELTQSLLKKVKKEKKETPSSAEETEINTERAEEEATIPNEKTTPLQKFKLTPEKKTLIIRVILIAILAGVGGNILYEQYVGKGQKSEEGGGGRELIEAESTINDPRAKEIEEKLKAKKAEMEARKQETQPTEEKTEEKEDNNQPIPTTEEKADIPVQEEEQLTEPTPPTTLEEPTPVQEEVSEVAIPSPEEAPPTPTVEGGAEPEVPNIPLGEGPITSTTPTPITPPPVVNLEEIQKTLEKTVVTPTPTARAEVAPPDYSNHGRGLVYNCREKHWACVNRMAYFQCQDHMLWAQEQGQKAECVIKQIYATDEDCHRAEQSEINAITEVKECL